MIFVYIWANIFVHKFFDIFFKLSRYFQIAPRHISIWKQSAFVYFSSQQQNMYFNNVKKWMKQWKYYLTLSARTKRTRRLSIVLHRIECISVEMVKIASKFFQRENFPELSTLSSPWCPTFHRSCNCRLHRNRLWWNFSVTRMEEMINEENWEWKS